MRRIVILAILTLTWLPGTSGARTIQFPVTPDPAECVADPIDIDRLLDLAATGPSASPAPAQADVTAGRTSPSLLDELSSIVVASVACTNANQPLRALSFFTEDYLLHRIDAEPAVTLGHLAAAATREPDVSAPEDRVTIETINAGPADDGVAFIAVKTTAGVEPTLASLRMLSTDAGWRIDAVFVAIID